jgi:hypothetical protein
MPQELPIACSLSATDAQTRKARWEAVAGAALLESERTAAGARQIYRGDADVELELAELIDLEAQCCAFLDFQLSREEGRLVLDVSGPPEAAEIVALFGAGAG